MVTSTKSKEAFSDVFDSRLTLRRHLSITLLALSYQPIRPVADVFKSRYQGETMKIPVRDDSRTIRANDETLLVDKKGVHLIFNCSHPNLEVSREIDGLSVYCPDCNNEDLTDIESILCA